MRRARLLIWALSVLMASPWLSGCPEMHPPPGSDVEVEVVLGTHVQWKRQPDDFVVLEEGGELW